MTSTPKSFLLKYGISSFMLVVIAIQFYSVKTKNLNKWKGGGFGMYSEIHYYYNQIYIPDMSVDSLIKDDSMKESLGFLMLMPNDINLKKSAELILKTTKRDSINIQIWRPLMNSESGVYTRVLENETYLKHQDL